MNTCPICGGSGRIGSETKVVAASDGRAVYFRGERCSACGGTGSDTIQERAGGIALSEMIDAHLAPTVFREIEEALLKQYAVRAMLRFAVAALGNAAFGALLHTWCGLSFRFWGLPLLGLIVEMCVFLFRPHTFYPEHYGTIMRLVVKFDAGVCDGLRFIVLFFAASVLVGYFETGQFLLTLKCSVLNWIVFVITAGSLSNVRACHDTTNVSLKLAIKCGGHPFRLLGKRRGVDRASLGWN